MTSDTKNTDPVRAELVRTSWTRHPCAVCGGGTDKDAVQAALTGDDDGYVCSECLKAGPGEIPKRLREQADALEAMASSLREAAERIFVLPSHEEWEQANRAFWEEHEKANEGQWGDDAQQRKEALQDNPRPA